MAKKKKKQQRLRRPPPAFRELELPPGITPEMLLDPRQRERLLGQLLGGQMDSESPPDTALDRAYELLDRAKSERNPARRNEFIQQAIAACPDCADAFLMLAEETPKRAERLALLQQAVQAGERALGPQAFRDHVGHFWGLVETRPYMRARHALAGELWLDGRFDEAVGHARELLGLNPGDNQGVRYELAAWLLRRERYDELADLLRQYEDDGSADWAWTRALLTFRADGASPTARKLLKAAVRVNKHVPAYLLEEEPLPPRRPEMYSPGGEDEAILYAGNNLAGWKAVPGAPEWLAQEIPPPKPKKPRPPRGPSPTALKRLKRLPQTGAVWQADARELPTEVEGEFGPVCPWAVLVVGRDRGLILAHALTEGAPGFDQLWDTMAGAMQRPTAGEPARPAELQVTRGPWEALRPALAELGIALAVVPELILFDQAFAGLSDHLTRGPLPGLLAGPGVTPEQGRAVFAAAADFYRQAPWKALGTEEAVRIGCPDFPHPWYAVVMGVGGMTFGVALYRDLELLQQGWANEMDQEEHIARTEALTVTFGPADETPEEDVAAANENGWPMAGPDAFPSIFYKEPGIETRPPTAEELDQLEACLRALPAFVRDRSARAGGERTVSVTTATGAHTLALSWVED